MKTLFRTPVRNNDRIHGGLISMECHNAHLRILCVPSDDLLRSCCSRYRRTASMSIQSFSPYLPNRQTTLSMVMYGNRRACHRSSTCLGHFPLSVRGLAVGSYPRWNRSITSEQDSFCLFSVHVYLLMGFLECSDVVLGLPGCEDLGMK